MTYQNNDLNRQSNKLNNMRKGSFNGSDTQRVTNRTMTVASNYKFQNLERLNTIVGQVTDRNNKQISMRVGKADMSDKVLDLIRNRIKTNCDKLYENYDENKKAILKQIQQVQTNMLSENAIHKGLENSIKEKSNYDKLKSQLQAKQKKLKKLTQIRDQLKGASTQNKQITQILGDKVALIQHLQSFKQTLDYQTAVLNNMKSDRRSVKLFLKEKYDKMLSDEQLKKQKIKKLENINHTKKANLIRIEQAFRKQQHCQIPQNLAGQLQRKLEEYEGKHIYSNIIKHQNIISEEMRRQFEADENRQRQQARRKRMEKEKEEMKEYELAYNFFLIKQQEEQKIKKICGVSSLSEIVNSNLQSDFQNLQTIKKQTQASINEIKDQNQKIKQEIERILTGKEEYNQDDLLKTQQQYVVVEKELKSLQINSEKKYENLNQWHSIIQMMCQKEVAKGGIGMVFKEILEQISNPQKSESSKKYSMENFDKHMQTNRASLKYKELRQEYESECSILDRSLA